jgi:tripartite ATP-independent transporter DctM subunit
MLETSVFATKRLNWLDKSIKILDKVGIFSRWTNIIGIVFLFLMVLFTSVDVVMRYIFNQPMVWVLEITEVMMIVAIFMGVSYTQNEKGHISIDVLTSILAPKPKLMLEFITTVLSFGTIVVVVWRIIVQTLFFISRNSSQSQFLILPKAPFAAILALGCATLALLLLRDILRVASRSHKMGLSRFQWVLMLLIPVLATVLFLLWMQPNIWISSLPLVGVIGVLFSLLLFLIGMPISFSLILTSLVFTAHIRGADSSLDTLGTEIYRNAGSYSWSVLPFFVMMGFLCFHARFGEDLYLAAYRWFGKMRGGLAIATVAACTGFAAIVGDGVAATATMGAVAVPEMRKYGYDDRLSSGSVVGGATLGPIIPPSTLFIIYGVLTSVSIGSLFVAGIIPGLLIAVIFCFIIAIWCRLNPNIGPAGASFGWKERITSLKAGGPVVILFILVIGGIYSGIFTPTEGGAIGAMGAFIIGLIMRRWNKRTFFNALLDSGKTVSMVFLILIGALIFTRFAAWCNLSGSLSSLINGMGLSSGTFMAIVLLVLVIFGCFIDIMPLVLIGVPVLYPVTTIMGIDPIWFGIMFCITVNLGALTPPVGINLFVFKGIFKEIPMGTIYRGAIPFVFGTVIAIIIMFFIPSLITWLPGILK